ncbi:hypothetical protein [Planococcus ruber]|uniref:hypothetical protein n=1 Tax=Planococcus ruber TaxID=2027871 RepID=UPI001FF05E3A|nr:hypothetical protein [Planococcus ruber]MCJ1907740.1 hypothetical protein [Planococcus ruber]
MQIEIAEFGKMSQSGSSLLNLIQNNDLPILDLLVREAVQNSLDAGITVKEHDSVFVDIGIKDINVEGFSSYLEGVTDQINKRFGSSPQKAIYIEDTHTSGLTGSLDFDHYPNSNIFKLIYGISMAQEMQGAGGSWGLGKTVYFRVGIGMVVYYSRILNESGDFEQRLAVTLVENEKLAESIIPKTSNKFLSGIAWWGERISQNSKGTVPITDDEKIHEILETLEMKPFTEESVGTKIIIPFIDEQKLLIKHETNESENKPWENDVTEYIRIAMQRWYSPRLGNKKYKYGKYLDGHVNGKRLEKEEFLAVFLEFQLMYNAAVYGSQSDRYFVSDIQIRNYFEHTKVNNAGRVAFKKFSRKELDMLAPINGPTPFALVNEKNTAVEGNAPLIAYVRKPGMIVSYELEGEWSKGISPTSEHEYLIAIFVPNSETKLLHPDGNVIDLEGYLRKSEMADHTSWSDIILNNKPVDIVEKIRNQVRRKIKLSFEIKEEVKDKQVMNALARNVGKMLLPPTGFGRRASSRNQAGTRPSVEKLQGSNDNKFKVLSQNYLSNGAIEVHFKMKLEKKVTAFTIEIFVASESGKISALEWEQVDSIGTPFPARITRIAFPETIGSFGRSTAKKSASKVLYAIHIEKKQLSVECLGSVVIECSDPHIQLEILMRPEGSGSNG